jgi:hypothetical protein
MTLNAFQIVGITGCLLYLGWTLRTLVTDTKKAWNKN